MTTSTTNRIFKTKVSERQVEALATLMSHDADLLIADDEGGLVSEDDYRVLVSLLNGLQNSPFREYVGG